MIEASEAEIERVAANAEAEAKYAYCLSEAEQLTIEESEAEIQRTAEAEAENKRLIEKAIAAINGKAELEDPGEIERYFALLAVQEETLSGYNRCDDVDNVVVSEDEDEDEDENEVDCEVVSEDEDEDVCAKLIALLAEGNSYKRSYVQAESCCDIWKIKKMVVPDSSYLRGEKFCLAVLAEEDEEGYYSAQEDEDEDAVCSCLSSP